MPNGVNIRELTKSGYRMPVNVDTICAPTAYIYFHFKTLQGQGSRKGHTGFSYRNCSRSSNVGRKLRRFLVALLRLVMLELLSILNA